VIEENQVRVGGSSDRGNLLYLAGTDERCGVGARAALQRLGDNLATGAEQQFAKLGERFFCAEALRLVCRSH
jgi:hypothetical protein